VIALSDGIPARRFPFVDVALVAAFFAHFGGLLFGVLVARLLAGASLRAMPDAA
jgi:membrane associated rhomboid family serine protease